MVGTTNNTDIYVQDDTSPYITFLFTQKMNTVTLAGAESRGDESIDVVAGHSIVTGEFLEIWENGIFFQVEVSNVATNTISLAKPLPANFTTSAIINRCKAELNVNGSVTPVDFTFAPLGGQTFDIRFVTAIAAGGTPDDGTFMGIAALTNGTQYYKINPVRTFDSYAYNIKKNACFTVNGFNTTYTTKGGGGGGYSVNVEIPFNEKHGVAIRVLPNEKITMKVNDDLSSLTGYRTSILGHVVE